MENPKEIFMTSEIWCDVKGEERKSKWLKSLDLIGSPTRTRTWDKMITVIRSSLLHFMAVIKLREDKNENIIFKEFTKK